VSLPFLGQWHPYPQPYPCHLLCFLSFYFLVGFCGVICLILQMLGVGSI
jgi:hypothetical protein